MTSEVRRRTFLGSKISILIMTVVGIVLAPIGYIFLSQPGAVIAQEQNGNTETENGENQVPTDEMFIEPLTAVVDMNSTRIVVSGTAASPGEEAGPFQILRILPERTDGKIYSGTISFTASAPIYVVPAFGFDAENQTLNHDEFGELIRFPSEASFTNNTLLPPELAFGPIMPQYGPPIADSSEGTLPSVYSASVPFAGDQLEVGNVNGTQFLISYTVVADVYETTRVSALYSAVVNTTDQGEIENRVSMVYGGVEETTDAYSPNPISIEAGQDVTWTNDDFLPHTVTSGTADQLGSGEAGQDFDSGFVGTRSSFTHTFEDSGEFDYFCALHPNMVGTVIVE